MSQDSHGLRAPAANSQEEPAAPAIPDFELLRRIGRGSYGEVWLARDLMGEYRAVKVVYRSRFSEDRPYDREYDGVRRYGRISLGHPSQLAVFHVGRGDGFFYYAMEVADDASELLVTAGDARRDVTTEVNRECTQMHANEVAATHKEPAPAPFNSRPLAPACRADYGEGRSIRGSRPEHLRCDSAGRTEDLINPRTYRPKTLRSLMRPAGEVAGSPPNGLRALPVDQCVEIGIALASALDHLHREGLVHRDIKPSNIVFVNGRPKLADIGLVAGADEDRSVVGTEGYLAPQGPGGVQADVFALGRVLYEMVTGFEAKHFPKLPDDWGARPDRKDLQALNQVVQWACEVRPDRQYKTAAALVADLELLRSHSSLKYQKLRRASRVLGLLSAVMALLVIASVFLVWLFRERAAESSFVAQLFRGRAAEERRSSIMAHVRASRRPSIHELEAGWFTNEWHRVESAAAIRAGTDVQALASALLAGLDARLVVQTDASANSAAFSANGECVVAGVAEDGLALLIDPNGELTRLPALGEGPVGWTPEGVPIQVVPRSDHAVMYELRTGLVCREFSLPGGEPASLLAMTPDGSRVAAALGNRVLLWETPGGGLLGEVTIPASALAFSPDGSRLAVGDTVGITHVYDVPSLAETAVLVSPLNRNRITCLAFGRDALVRLTTERPTHAWVLATGEQGGGIVVWDLHQLQPRSFCRGSTWTVSDVAFDADGVTLAAAGLAHTRLWDAATGRTLLGLGMWGMAGPLTLAFDHRGQRILCGGKPGNTRNASQVRVGVWELERHRGIDELRGLTCAARKVWFSGDSRRLGALSDDGHLAVWDLVRRQLVCVFETPQGGYADSAGGCFDADARRFAFARGREGYLFDLGTGTVLRRWQLKEGRGDQLEFDAEGRLLLVRCERPAEVPGEEMRIWRLYELGESEEFAPLFEQNETNWCAQELLFRPTGEQFLVGLEGAEGSRRAVRVYDIKSGRAVWQCAAERSGANIRVCVDPGGRWFGFTLGGSDGLGIVDFEQFRRVNAQDQSSQAIHPSGQEFATWTMEGHFALRDAKTGRAVSLRTDWTELSWVGAFSADGNLFACGTEEGVVLVAEIAEVKRRLAELEGRGEVP